MIICQFIIAIVTIGLYLLILKSNTEVIDALEEFYEKWRDK